jgi:hypothetical protein
MAESHTAGPSKRSQRPPIDYSGCYRSSFVQTAEVRQRCCEVTARDYVVGGHVECPPRGANGLFEPSREEMRACDANQGDDLGVLDRVEAASKPEMSNGLIAFR